MGDRKYILLTFGLALFIGLPVNFVSPRHPASDFTCNRGFYVSKDLQGLPVCKMCPPGTFISEDNHQYVDCLICSAAEDNSHEVAYQSCSSDTDTVIGCEKGYFRQEDKKSSVMSMRRVGKCKKCMNCRKWAQYEYRPCGYNQDTVCCPEPAMVRIDRGQGPECLFKSKDIFSKYVMKNYNVVPRG